VGSELVKHISNGQPVTYDWHVQIRVLYGACFPGEEEPGETVEDFMSRITFLHNPEECVWFLLWIPGPERYDCRAVPFCCLPLRLCTATSSLSSSCDAVQCCSRFAFARVLCVLSILHPQVFSGSVRVISLLLSGALATYSRSVMHCIITCFPSVMPSVDCK
jgi:hypothetical protein